jgi:hypothetical protein
MYPSFDFSKDNADEKKCFIDTQGKMYCNGASYFNVQENVDCPNRMCEIERKVECNGQDRCEASKTRLSISKNDQIYDRFVNEKHTWK